MKKFSFSLESVLSFKNMLLDEVKNKHAEAIAAVLAQEKIAHGLNATFQSTNEEFNNKKNTGMTVLEAATYTGYMESLAHEIEKAKSKLDYLKKAENKCHGEVVEAKKEVSSLEKLKEQNLVAYNAMIAKSEELAIEEFVINSKFGGN